MSPRRTVTAVMCLMVLLIVAMAYRTRRQGRFVERPEPARPHAAMQSTGRPRAPALASSRTSGEIVADPRRSAQRWLLRARQAASAKRGKWFGADVGVWLDRDPAQAWQWLRARRAAGAIASVFIRAA